jgi:membrane-bound serine protease (ClpP class)
VDAPIPEMRISLLTLLPAALVMAGGTFALVHMVVGAQRLKATTGAEGMVGQQGLVEVALDPEGWVRVQGERWRARAETPVKAGSPVTVVAVEGLSLKVRGGA